MNTNRTLSRVETGDESRQQNQDLNMRAAGKTTYSSGVDDDGSCVNVDLHPRIPYFNQAQQQSPKQLFQTRRKDTNVTLYQHDEHGQQQYMSIVSNGPQQCSQTSFDDEVNSPYSPNHIPNQPLLIDIKNRSSFDGSLGHNRLSQPNAQQQYALQTNRNTFYSQKKGVDVNRLIKQRKDVLMQQRVQQSRARKNLQFNREGQVCQEQSTGTEVSTQNTSLQQALNITQKRGYLTSVEEGQLVSGIEQIVRSLFFADGSEDLQQPLQQQQSQISPSQTLRQSTQKELSENESESTIKKPKKITLEILNIVQQKTNVAPQSVKHEARQSSFNMQQRRSLVLPGRKPQLQQQQEAEQSVQQRGQFELKEKQVVDYQTQLIVRNLSDELKLKFIRTFNAVPLQQEQCKEVERHVQDMIYRLRQRRHEMELKQIKSDMIRGNKKLREIKERFVSPTSSQFSNSTGMSYIGNVPLQEPPYTLRYTRDRKERLERRKNGMPINITSSIQSTSMPPPRRHTVRSNESVHENSLPELNLVAASAMMGVPAPPEVRNTKRIQTQQTTGGNGRRRINHDLTSSKQKKNGLEQQSQEESPKSTIMQKYAQRVKNVGGHGHSIFQMPVDVVLNKQPKISNSLLLREKTFAAKLSVSSAVQQKERKKKTKPTVILGSTNLAAEDSVFTVNGEQNQKLKANLDFEDVNDARKLLSHSAIELADPAEHDSILEVDLLQQSYGDKNMLFPNYDQYSKYLNLPQSQSKSPVKVEESYEQQHSTSKMRFLQKNGSQAHAGREKQLISYQQELMESQLAFEKQVEDSSLQHEAFTQLVQNREKLFDRIFKKSFKMGTTATLLPTVVQDLVTAIIDGYQSSLKVFDKFSLRQKQQFEYKIERLSKINDDIRAEMQKKALYDEFLKKKLDNLKEEMERIEGKIDRFNDITLLGEDRKLIKDTFSEVSVHLENIAHDLSQERVTLFSSQVVDENAAGQNNKQQARVEPLEVIPFQTFKSQIDSNYSEIQTKTTKAIIQRLGLGNKVCYVNLGTQTGGTWVEASELKVAKCQLFDNEALIQKLTRESIKLKLVYETTDNELTKKKKSNARVKQNLSETTAQMFKSQKVINDLEARQLEFPLEMAKKQSEIVILTEEVKKMTKKTVVHEKKIFSLNEEIKDFTEKLGNMGKEEIVQVVERLNVLEVKTVKKKEKIKQQHFELVEVHEKIEELRGEYQEVTSAMDAVKEKLNKTNQDYADMLLKYDQQPPREHFSHQSAKSTVSVRKSLAVSLQQPLTEEPSESELDSPTKKTISLKKSSNLLLSTRRSDVQEESVKLEVESAVNDVKQETDQGSLNERQSEVDESSKLENSVFKPNISVSLRQSLETKSAADTEKLNEVIETPPVILPLLHETDEDLVEKRSSLADIDDPDMLSQDLSKESSVSSAELGDQVKTEPIDVISMRKVLRRQATMCPTKSNLRHVCAQTDISGPVFQHMQQPVQWSEAMSEAEERKTVKKQNSMIYAFSYQQQQNTQATEKSAQQLDKHLVSKSGKIAKGRVFRKPTNIGIEEFKLGGTKLGVNPTPRTSTRGIPFMVNHVGQNTSELTVAREESESRRMSLGGTKNNDIQSFQNYLNTQNNSVEKKRSGFFVEDPMYRSLNKQDSRVSSAAKSPSQQRFGGMKQKTLPLELTLALPSPRRGTVGKQPTVTSFKQQSNESQGTGGPSDK